MPTLASVEQAVAVLHRGGLIACPTEGVWGLGCDPFDEAAVRRLLALKQRAVGKGLILVAAAAAQFDGLVDWEALPPARREVVLDSWPGPHSWVVPVTTKVPAWIRGDHDTVAVRVSAHPLLAALCTGFGGALVSTSANVAGDPPPLALAGLAPRIRDGVDAIVAGETSGLSQPTTIRNARNGRQLR